MVKEIKANRKRRMEEGGSRAWDRIGVEVMGAARVLD
jgi:hypothetical protein